MLVGMIETDADYETEMIDRVGLDSTLQAPLAGTV